MNANGSAGPDAGAASGRDSSGSINNRGVPSPPGRRRTSRPLLPASGSPAGFTLLEILLALALVGLLLVSLNTFIFSMGELWGRNTDVRLFEQHARAVTRFLEHELRSAALPPAARANSTPISPQEVKPQDGLMENMLTFELPAGSRLFRWPDRPLPEVVCSFQVRAGQGLVLLWHSRLEKNFDTDAPREIVVTPLVSALAYDYFDADTSRWSTETTLKPDAQGKPLTPQRLRLTFGYGKMKSETVIALPTPGEGLPAF
jgi:prepilin-type N-terminal cleavage/methylation domain-containing protein